jgi:hypothetical protein
MLNNCGRKPDSGRTLGQSQPAHPHGLRSMMRGLTFGAGPCQHGMLTQLSIDSLGEDNV